MTATPIPLMLAGPVIRRVTCERISLWLATSEQVDMSLCLLPDGDDKLHLNHEQMAQASQMIAAGEHLYFYLIDLKLTEALPEQVWIEYDLKLVSQGGEQTSWRDWAPELVYQDQRNPGFIIKPNITHLLHGSCRKPHHPSGDGLLAADKQLALSLNKENTNAWPSLLMLSGDQIYADDVATPMLVACHQLIQRLGMFNEPFSHAAIDDSNRLHNQLAHYFKREQLLPELDGNHADDAIAALFKAVKKPIFTTDTAHNHLISLAEVLAMYLLVWSPAPWQLVDMSMPPGLTEAQGQAYQVERNTLTDFATGLAKVQRLMAHIPCAMMFDDHDVTDDWNLTAAWEQAAYGHPFSKRILGNALLGYFICQGWGNAPEQFSPSLMAQVQQVCRQPGTQQHDELIQTLLNFDHWHYQWPTQPALVVLDTRTHRWRSERNLNAPSGLMDWEALTDLQQTLLGKEAVILVSPAPIFGVKLIEVVQKIFTWLGKPLMVDAENWMAHPGAANVLLNLFRHSKTPQQFVILSGDVHYSFAYQVQLRGRQGGPDIWQVTSSGIKNEFPAKLLDVLDRLNRWLYAPYSPLNWFTRRRRMKVVPLTPNHVAKGECLVNASGIGLLTLDEDGSVAEVRLLPSQGLPIVFEANSKGAHWQ
ncbi:alkaline phosphatase D family protein [Motilimonas sp. KMU-193]|uniref:alkaline phosphatase D family protein n=1 Tax=Motilimonas sp. KMU-193 TaxID=3388668 RepID=UPI00396AFE96